MIDRPAIRRPCRTAPLRLLACLVVALGALGMSPELRAQATTAAVPEFIELGEAERQTPAGAALTRAQETFRVSLTDDRERALEAAKELVALTRETYGDSHDHVARALTNLAIVQAEDANFGAAIENYSAAVRTREAATESIVARDLINPLRGLASAYMALDDIERAIPFYERAIHISHVNDGPENLDQVEIIEALSKAHYFHGDLDAAGELQDAIFRLRERRAEDDPDQYLDALEHRADWHVRLGDYERAIRTYRQLRRTMAAEYGADDARLIEPLVALADAYREQTINSERQRGISARTGARWPSATRVGGLSDPRTLDEIVAQVNRCQTSACAEAVLGSTTVRGRALREGRMALNRAVRIARADAAEHPERLARTLVKQADWLASMEKARDARRRYRDAWRILDEDPELHATRDELFDAPVAVAGVAFRQAYGERDPYPADPVQYPDRGYADIAFDVDRRGRPKNVRIVSADPAGLMDQHLLRQMRRVKFRPAFSDGGPRQDSGLVYRHAFRYDASGLSEKERNRIAATVYDAAIGEPALRSINLNAPQDDGLAEATDVTQEAPQVDGEPTP